MSKHEKTRLNWWIIIPVWLAAALLVMSLAMYRHKVESANGTADLSATILFAFISIGPALASEGLFFLLRPVAPVWKAYQLTKKRRKTLQREHRTATAYVAFIDYCREAYENEWLRLEALYDEIYYSTKGRPPQSPSAGTTSEFIPTTGVKANGHATQPN